MMGYKNTISDIDDKVGIGTINPGYKLDVNGSFRGGGIQAESGPMIFTYNEQPVLYGYLGTGDIPAAGLFGVADSGINSEFPASEAIRISSDGNVGINTTSPDTNAKLNVLVEAGSNKSGAHFQGAASGTNYGARAIEVTNVPYGAGIHFNYNTIYGGTACSFRNSSNSQVGTIVIGPSSTAYNTSSDYRLKENITPITGSIDRLMNLKPSRFNFIEEPDTVVDGFIAHEAKEVVPESVTGEKDEVNPIGEPVYQAIDQGKLVPLLTAALQDAITKIEQLETRIQTLENND